VTSMNTSSASSDSNRAKVEPQLFNLTAHDVTDYEGDFFPGPARQLHDRPLLNQSGDDNALLQASHEPLLAGPDTNPLPQCEAWTVGVPLAVDLNVPPLPECVKHAVEGPVVAHLDMVAMPVAAA